MTLLMRYLARRTLFLLGAILLAGISLYVLTDLFERLDGFIESGAEWTLPLIFFAGKVPTIVAQILPAVFMIAMVAQLHLLERSRELTALWAGGIAPVVLLRFVLLSGLGVALLQFTCAQFLGVAGERVAARIWQEDVRGKVLADESISGIWFTEGGSIVHMRRIYPVQGRGENILVYRLDAAGASITEIVKARRFTVAGDDTWLLEEGERLIPADYSATEFERLELPIRQNLQAFQLASRSGGIKASQLSPRELEETIARLESAGSNVEALRTAWHAKMAYAGSIIVLGLLALLVSRITSNIYKALGLALLTVFFFYGMNTVSVTLGEKGIVSPFVGAWFADLFFLFAGVLWLMAPGVGRLWKR